METQSDALLKRYNQLYLEVILRYKDYIEQNENLNVAELPKLVTPANETVEGIANGFKGTFSLYSYKSNFVAGANLAYDYVQKKILHLSLPIEFWLYPADTIKCEAGDLFDKATLLCSLLIALGNPSARVITSVKPNERRFMVYCEYEGRVLAFDLDRGMINFDSKEKLVESLCLKEEEDTTAYEFNNEMYNNLA